MNINYLSRRKSRRRQYRICINTVCNYSNATANRRLYAVLYSITWHVPLRAWPNRSPSLIFNRRCRCRTLSLQSALTADWFLLDAVCKSASSAIRFRHFAIRSTAICTLHSVFGTRLSAIRSLLTLCANPLLRLSRRARAARIRCPRAGAGRDPLRGGRSRSRPRVLCPPE